ncbi:hypothetical protein Smp_048030 [Schistosoma mansoni]|uniref:hypothetical protein n=1 Tax=Schistosoma mansoni TaxID=6183 RepID=UPI0001A6438F|nr:hypothetical protein Smp_048030 [Schistosoma mansoni]|eukprot:XP_018650584.1 hypothetical protein Smp_048030 [Schistosoma mansoni]
MTVDRESNCHEIPSTGIPSTSFTNGRLLEDNGCYNVNLCSHKSVNRKEQINKILMTLMTTKSLSIRDADRILNDFRVFLPDLPASIRSPVILQTTLPKLLYLNFKRLAPSPYFLAHPELHNRVIVSVKMDFRNFLKEYEWRYGCENLVHNVYLLQHIPDDVLAHGLLNTHSAFPFESYVRQINKSVHSGYSVAKQAAQRYAERMSFCNRPQVSISTNITQVTGKANSRKKK